MSAASRLVPPQETDTENHAFPLCAPHGAERGLLSAAAGAALLLHAALLLLVALPETRLTQVLDDDDGEPLRIIDIPLPPPPPPAVPRPQVTPGERLLPIPDEEPELPEPVRETPPRVEIETSALNLPDLDLGLPAAPPMPDRPLVVGVDTDVSAPALIPHTRVEPVYPELARIAGVEGNVILRAVVRADGSVGEVEVLRCDRPRLGFEAAAVEAVQQWQYVPATQHGRAVDVYITVYIAFALR